MLLLTDFPVILPIYTFSPWDKSTGTGTGTAVLSPKSTAKNKALARNFYPSPHLSWHCFHFGPSAPPARIAINSLNSVRQRLIFNFLANSVALGSRLGLTGQNILRAVPPELRRAIVQCQETNPNPALCLSSDIARYNAGVSSHSRMRKSR